MFSSANVSCLGILILCSVIAFAASDCQIELPNNPDTKPTLYKYVGTHKLKVNTNINTNVLTLHEHQKIEAHCDTTFKEPSFAAQIIYILCKDRYTYIYRTENQPESAYDNYRGRTISTECSGRSWDLYESSYNFVWCPTNVTSFILARNEKQVPPLEPNFNYLAGICYDIYNSSFNSVYYTLGPNHIENYQPDILESMYKPGINIQYIKETFESNRIPANDFITNQLFYAEYGFASMIQHSKLDYAYNDKFSNLLEFLWWPNLRLYNWKRYLNALEKHVEDDKKIYDILAGVSGALRVPKLKSCGADYSLGEVVINEKQKIPLYVWNYLQETSNSSNEVVIIGFNSPFHELYSHDDNAIVFCEDRCGEISWLKHVSSSFRYSAMGIVFCCNVQDVRSSGRLIGFPEIDIKPKLVENTELPSTTYDIGANEIDDETLNE